MCALSNVALYCLLPKFDGTCRFSLIPPHCLNASFCCDTYHLIWDVESLTRNQNFSSIPRNEGKVWILRRFLNLFEILFRRSFLFFREKFAALVSSYRSCNISRTRDKFTLSRSVVKRFARFSLLIERKISGQSRVANDVASFAWSFCLIEILYTLVEQSPMTKCNSFPCTLRISSSGEHMSPSDFIH